MRFVHDETNNIWENEDLGFNIGKDLQHNLDINHFQLFKIYQNYLYFTDLEGRIIIWDSFTDQILDYLTSYEESLITYSGQASFSQIENSHEIITNARNLSQSPAN